MASITRETNGRRTIQFMAADGKRRSIRLGKVTQRLAEEIKVKVEFLVAAMTAGLPLDGETTAWVARLGDDLAGKLAAVGLIPPRKSARLKGFIDDYIVGRRDTKPRTALNMKGSRGRLVEYFGEEKDLRSITPADADGWLCWLKENYSRGTAGRDVRRVRQFFRAAVRGKLIDANPFADLRAPDQSEPTRQFFLERDAARRVFAACPDAQWRLIVALCRYGGLRCPTEVLALEINDVDWERQRFWVRSEKTEGQGKPGRWVPLFPELVPYLEEVFDSAAEGTVHFITRYRTAECNLRTQLTRIVKRAGLTPWPKLFVNMRASRATELTAQFPAHVAAAWLGHTPRIAAKHYLQVTEADFARAACPASGAESGAGAVQKPVQHAAAPSRTAPHASTEYLPEQGVVRDGATRCEAVQNKRLSRAGIEPAPRT
jgi:integrase